MPNAPMTSTLGSLPDGLATLLDEYHRNHPNSVVALDVRQQFVDGRMVSSVGDPGALPKEGERVTLSVSMTVSDGKTLKVVTDVFVGHLERPSFKAINTTIDASTGKLVRSVSAKKSGVRSHRTKRGRRG